MSTPGDLRQAALRALPAVHALVDAAQRVGEGVPRLALLAAARASVASARATIEAGQVAPTISAVDIVAAARQLAKRSLRPVINATGVVLHTNLGRAPLPSAAIEQVVAVSSGYCNLEYELHEGQRGSRHDHVAALAATLCGAEAAVVVNNNAAATVLALTALASDREVVVSRGELVEIGGAFRVPDILALSRCRLVEVGTTNKTRLSDYEKAIGANAAMLLKVHRSNFAIVGFTDEVGATDLADLARSHGLSSMVDLGSGALISQHQQRELGLPAEPTVMEIVASGVDVVCFSGDKLLGGPQAGLLVGRAAVIAKLRSHPLMRALRPDKLTLAALEATLSLYRDGAWSSIPTLAKLVTTEAELRVRADALVAAIHQAGSVRCSVVACVSTVGGGSMPTAALPSLAVALGGDANHNDQLLRRGEIPIVGRIVDGRLLLDVRTIHADEVELVAAACAAL